MLREVSSPFRKNKGEFDLISTEVIRKLFGSQSNYHGTLKVNIAPD